MIKINQWDQVFKKVNLNKISLMSDENYQKGFEIGIAYFASYEGKALPEEIEVPDAIAHQGRLSHVSYKTGVEDGWKFVDKLK